MDYLRYPGERCVKGLVTRIRTNKEAMTESNELMPRDKKPLLLSDSLKMLVI
jgi:hypothetical protein